MFKNLTILALLAVIAVGGALAVLAQGDATDIEVRVWERTDNPESNYISARPASGSWRTLGTIPLDMDSETSNGSYRYADISLTVPLAGSTVAPAPEESWPVRSFDLMLGEKRGRNLTAAVRVPVRLKGTVYVYVEDNDPLAGVGVCHNSFTLFPEDGFTAMSCSVDVAYDGVARVRAEALEVTEDGYSSYRYEYRCKPDNPAGGSNWTCSLLD
ncbi:MAG: hypothetical protein OXE43_04605 [Chloroflexi bacterium]|nr:hypothetical protein [Chloroflexota bacterium]